PLALAFYLGAVFVNDGLISFRDSVVVIFVLLYAAMGASQAQAAVPDAGRLSVALTNVFDLVDREPEIDSRGGEGADPDAATVASAASRSARARGGAEALRHLSSLLVRPCARRRLRRPRVRRRRARLAYRVDVVDDLIATALLAARRSLVRALSTLIDDRRHRLLDGL
ncbi:MAG: hypothetical protein VX017_11320, partial [Pseudomonadota bacterium]|nr:hypothetical protein [Pseudomonadota bacterium]